MICEYCHGIPHEGKPELCKGNTWCDCNHRLPPVDSENETKENNNE